MRYLGHLFTEDLAFRAMSLWELLVVKDQLYAVGNLDTFSVSF